VLTGKYAYLIRMTFLTGSNVFVIRMTFGTI
jgi:hypothetical protein